MRYPPSPIEPSSDDSADDGLDDFACWGEDDEVGVGAGLEDALAVADSQHARGVECGQADGGLEGRGRECSDVANSAVHGQHAAGEAAFRFAALALDFDLQRTEAKTPIAHAGGADGVGDEHGAAWSLAVEKELDHFRVDVDAVGNNIGSEAVVGENCAQDAGLAMIERAHGIESVGGVACSGLECAIRLLKSGVGVADACADPTSGGFGYYFDGVRDFRGNGEDGDLASRRVPKLLKKLKRAILYICGWMDTALGVADEGPFQVYADGSGVPVRRLFNGGCEPFKRAQRLVDGRGDGGGAVAGDTVKGKELPQGRKGREVALHDIVAGAAVNVDVDESWSEDVFAKIEQANTGRNFRVLA